MLKLRNIRLVAACLASGIILSVTQESSAQTLQINELKANYLVGFSNFARWDGTLNTEEVSIGVLGSKELINHLNQIAKKKTDGRSLNVLQLQPGDYDILNKVNILYVAPGYKNDWPKLFEECRDQGVLLVGEQNGFIQSGGAIKFVFRENRLRFYVSATNAKRYGIKISSTLIELGIDSL